ncbi:hypothetical protein QJS10_CPA16g00452 [Acorus calamus]|uniref:Uncharacterized protein n=1 Tax=Acorus calamus TaxID=4465 RepID=A0AAV9D2N4_ACOCL|nr:hypothetical protein QJS10_CPA16g00452 [Acorus calamus]
MEKMRVTNHGKRVRFITVQPIDPAIIRMDGEKCIVRDGLPIHFNDVIKFNYAWDRIFIFVPISSQIACS